MKPVEWNLSALLDYKICCQIYQKKVNHKTIKEVKRVVMREPEMNIIRDFIKVKIR